METGFKSLERPETFQAAYDICKPANGQYEVEAQAIWTFLSTHNIKSIVEIGRNLGGNTFLMGCGAKELEEILSLDIVRWSLTDDVMQPWFDYHGIHNIIGEADSLDPEAVKSFDYKLESDEKWDFVYIDGGHTSEIVSSDINNWKDRCHYIGFHDYADKKTNAHRKYFRGVTKSITKAKETYGWTVVGERANSEVVFKT